MDYVEGEWTAFIDILTRKDGQITSQMPQLQMKVTDENRMLQGRIKDTLADWNRSKPVGSDIDPNDAISTLVIFEGRFGVLKEEFDNLEEARLALDLDVRKDDRLDSALEEVKDLKNSWGELGAVFNKIKELKEITWAAVVPSKIKKSIADILKEMRELPAGIKSYASYESTLQQVQGYKESNKIVEMLKSEALKDRHWKVLLKKIGFKGLMSELNLGQLWEMDLLTKKAAIDQVMLEAQGELALEKFLQQTDEEWVNAELDLVDYQRKTKLIRGWQDLFDKTSERLSSLGQMKLSPYVLLRNMHYSPAVLAFYAVNSMHHMLIEGWYNQYNLFLHSLFDWPGTMARSSSAPKRGARSSISSRQCLKSGWVFRKNGSTSKVSSLAVSKFARCSLASRLVSRPSAPSFWR